MGDGVAFVVNEFIFIKFDEDMGSNAILRLIAAQRVPVRGLFFLLFSKVVASDVEECSCHGMLTAKSMLVCRRLDANEVLYEPSKQFGEWGE